MLFDANRAKYIPSYVQNMREREREEKRMCENLSTQRQRMKTEREISWTLS